MIQFLKNNYLLILILVLACALRFIKLGTIPIGFNDDEAAFGYNAYSILKTGRDEWARFLPFPVFESFGDWKLVVYLYLTVISQFILGVNEFATRFPSALFGVLAVWATYLLTKKLFENSDLKFEIGNLGPQSMTLTRTASFAYLKFDIPTIAALLLAISPWHIVASRNAFESDLLVFFITIATYFFLKGFEKPKWLTVSFITYALSLYIYRSSWLFVPLFIGTLIYSYRENFRKNWSVLARNLILFFVLLTPLIPVFLTFRGQSRFFQESFIAGVARIGITNEVNERRGICQNHLPSFLCSIAYNKYVFFIKSYTSNYLKNLSYETFFENSSPTGFQSFMRRSAFYLFELPLVLVGIIFIFKTKTPAAKILIPWILLAPIGAAITGIGNFGRINLIMPAPQIIAAFGLVSLVSFANKASIQRLAILVLSLVIFYSFVKFMIDIFYIEPFYTSRYQRYGYKELFAYLSSLPNHSTPLLI